MKRVRKEIASGAAVVEGLPLSQYWRYKIGTVLGAKPVDRTGISAKAGRGQIVRYSCQDRLQKHDLRPPHECDDTHDVGLSAGSSNRCRMVVGYLS